MHLQNQKILMMVAEEYEELELHYPKYRLMEEGATVEIATPKAGETYKGHHGYPCKGTLAINHVDPTAFTGLILPGGYSPDHLRANPKVLEIVNHFHQAKKLIAYICHAGWVPISAKIMKGVKCTSYHTIKDDLINAGAKWEDAPVVVDGHIISSRSPDDLPFFCPAIINFLSQKTKVAR